MIFQLFLCAFFLAFGSNPSYAEHTSGPVQVDGSKVYVNTDAIEVQPHGIWIHLGNECLPVDRLQVDEQGIFFTLDQLGTHRRKCPFCDWDLIGPFCVNPNCVRKSDDPNPFCMK